ncbi:MAG: hypothetical protein AAFX53_02480 [Bacteroidota bacterium]
MKTLVIIHAALCLGLIFAIVLFYSLVQAFSTQMDASDPLTYGVPIAAILGYFGSKFFFRKQVESISKDDALKTKFSKYQTASIIQYGLLEAPAFLGILAYYLTANALFLVISVTLTLYIMSLRPSKEKFTKVIPLDGGERRNLDEI